MMELEDEIKEVELSTTFSKLCGASNCVELAIVWSWQLCGAGKCVELAIVWS
jgi:hypothetical protein